MQYADFSPTALIRTCAGSRDELAWTEFIRRFQPVIASAVLRTARLWLEPPRALLDDLVQETYLKLCENDSHLLLSFRPVHDDSIYGFLKVVANNVVHDYFKSAMAVKRGASLTDAIPTRAQREPISDPDGFTIVSHRIQLEQIDRVLRQITAGKDQERKRIIFWLRHRQGLTAHEIAAIPSIGLSTEGVESVLMRLASQIRSHTASSSPHREVKVLPRQSRSNKRLGT